MAGPVPNLPERRQAILTLGQLGYRDSWSDNLYTACDDEQIAKNLNGASGGGVFDTFGNVVGVLLSTSLSSEGSVIFFARVELFHKNWAELVTSSAVAEIDSELRVSATPGREKLMSELSEVNTKH